MRQRKSHLRRPMWRWATLTHQYNRRCTTRRQRANSTNHSTARIRRNLSRMESPPHRPDFGRPKPYPHHKNWKAVDMAFTLRPKRETTAMKPATRVCICRSCLENTKICRAKGFESNPLAIKGTPTRTSPRTSQSNPLPLRCSLGRRGRCFAGPIPDPPKTHAVPPKWNGPQGCSDVECLAASCF